MRPSLNTACAAILLMATAQADATLARQIRAGSLPTPPPITDTQFQADALRAHNVERQLVGVPPLAWSPELAASALVWANRLAASSTLAHDRQRAYGENLWTNRAGVRTVGSMIGGWSIEKVNFVSGTAHPNTSRTGDWRSVGHYQQMVWSRTKAVGCAVARGATNDFLVCRYWPIGNWRGQKPFDASRQANVER